MLLSIRSCGKTSFQFPSPALGQRVDAGPPELTGPSTKTALTALGTTPTGSFARGPLPPTRATPAFEASRQNSHPFINSLNQLSRRQPSILDRHAYRPPPRLLSSERRIPGRFDTRRLFPDQRARWSRNCCPLWHSLTAPQSRSPAIQSPSRRSRTNGSTRRTNEAFSLSRYPSH
ncbi:hypothetical protein N656DRAFT_142664 [Canariomyces notabilis]|uniref:Uncharacterized protein n=1 Tax=Canariomyces notabilis TaxID=2074819 RepID=A0AAN6TC16_9PEZI|nr:hypothetical protein N656DRAFT_142664 [Canariomyces arenarius]